MIDERKTLYLILNQISFQEYVRLFSRRFFLLYHIKGIVMKPISLLDILQRATNNMQIFVWFANHIYFHNYSCY